MDFGSLLYEAQRNERSTNKEPVRCYKTAFEPPKKDSKGKTLSVNIKKFLQKKEEEERRKENEARKKREELEALRSQDKKAQKRVQVMLKRTKSANKSVMEDAIDNVNTVDTMAGPAQPDEDDYGYVSQEASAFYNKLMDKYAHMPAEEPKFSQAKKTSVKDVKEMNAAKERVRQALNRVEEEEMMPHKRKRKSKGDKSKENEDGFIDDNDYRQGSCKDIVEEEPPPKKPKRPMAPPPLDFNSLLKIAEQKQYEPVVIEKKVEDIERPLTKKQRLEMERERDWRMRKTERESEKLRNSGNPKANTNRIPKLSDSQNRIPKLSESQNRIPKLSETQNRKSSLSEGTGSKNTTDRSSDDRRKYRDEDYERETLDHTKSKPIVQFDRGRQNSQMRERDVRSSDVDRKRQRNLSGSDDDRRQPNNEYNERKSSQQSYSDKKRPSERSEYQNDKYNNDSDNDRSRSKSNKGRQESTQERKYTHVKSERDQSRSNEYDRSRKYNDMDEGRSREERQYPSTKSGRDRSQSTESDREQSRRYRDSEDDRRRMGDSRGNSEMIRNKTHSYDSHTNSKNYDSEDDRIRTSNPEREISRNKTHSYDSYSNSKNYDSEDDRTRTSKSEREKSRNEYDQTRRNTQTKSNYDRKPSSVSNREKYNDSDDDRQHYSKSVRDKPKTELNQNRSSYGSKSIQERRQSPDSSRENSRNYHDSDDDRQRAVKSNCDRQNSDRNKIKSYERSRSYDSEDERPPKSDREKSKYDMQQSRHNSQIKSDHDRGQDDRSRSKTSSNSEQTRSRPSERDSDRKRIPPKQDQRKPQNSTESKGDGGRNVLKTNHRLSFDSDSEKPRVNWKSDRERVPESRPRNIDERAKFNSDRDRQQIRNKYDHEKNSKRERSQSPIDSDYDRNKSKKMDERKIIENNRDKSKPSLNSQDRPRVTERLVDKKVTTVSNAEERLKKSADVWSKPCNITPPRPTLKNRLNGPLDRQKESRNDKPRPSTERSNSSPIYKTSPGMKPIQKEVNRTSSGYSDKIIVGKPGPSSKPNIMKAAAVRAAELRTQKPSAPPEKKNERIGPSKSEVSSSNVRSKPNEIKPRQFPPNDLKPKQFPPNDLKPKQFPPNDLKPKKFPPADLKPKQFPPADLKPKQFPPKDVRPKQFPPPDVRRKPKPPVKRRIIEDSDEEYDSEMDDFIDDGPEESADYSKYISEIFGYDKSRYVDDEDEECMESSFAQQMKEDIRSTKIGIMEDLEDMRKEKEELKMKAMKKKTASKPQR